ncbi:pyrroloquinoline quinone biosynthesis protein PqqF [Pseudomonas sp. Pse1]|uniref:pyrroloquinoline quinone biosynthesis protein PqqF n=1 Tax=Pseudomonas sp. Pse1 TaxID=2926020 RepID=UPI0021192627|nr:pyrroloquinoline quinone biosynthesis protein PqqF [Pseudomonas sp. Pse1]
MPAPIHLLPHSETLANGLRVSLRHAPGLQRCAAVLRVAAGSHDAPSAWPGLAHFLEHLLFLGTERFPAADGLMAYVQRHGGQLNARTNDRHTDYFFELPPQTFAGGLERLCDMLAHARLDPEDQLREREVLEAEFIAWSRDATAQQRQALFAGLAEDHPLRGFHAGNRDSLAVQQPQFQQALNHWYRHFYQTGQMTLSLVGPQPVDELRQLAQSLSAPLPNGERQGQTPPPALMTTTEQHYQQTDGHRLNLLFVLHGLPDGAEQALDFLCTWLNASKPGGLLAELRNRQWVDSLSAKPLYHFTGQALLHVEFDLSDAGRKHTESIRDLLNDWLSFFARQADWPALREEYALLQQRKRQSSNALALARLDNQALQSFAPENLVPTLNTIVQQLNPAPVDNPASHWQLPPPNGFLRSAEEPPSAGLIRGQTSAHRGLRTFAQDRTRGRRERSSMQFSQALPDSSGEGALCLSWHFDAAPAGELHATLVHSLQSLIEDASQAGVELSFSEIGNQWQLKLSGWLEPLPAILEQALQRLTNPAAASRSAAATPVPLIAIRQLLKALPQVCLDAPAAPALNDLHSFWASAQWHGLAAGLPASVQTAVTRVLAQVPGTPANELPSSMSINGQRLWSEFPDHGTEQAILLFCPTPTQSLADEAAWRMLAHLCQTPYYQRLRVELQLGYAVFSGVRQINGQTGLLFGVQSPNVSATDLLEHILTFSQSLPQLIDSLSDQALQDQLQSLAGQLERSNLTLPQAFELLWQGKLANHSSEYLVQLHQSILQLQRSELLDAARRLNQAEGGWRGLANAACSPDWQPNPRSLPQV